MGARRASRADRVQPQARVIQSAQEGGGRHCVRKEARLDIVSGRQGESPTLDPGMCSRQLGDKWKLATVVGNSVTS